MLFRRSTNKSFQVSVMPGKHQCMQSSCFFPPAVDGWASALYSLMWVMSKMWKSEPLRALYRCSFTRRPSTLVPFFLTEKNSSTSWGDKGCERWQEPPWSQSPPSKCLGDCVRKNRVAPGWILFWTSGIYKKPKNLLSTCKNNGNGILIVDFSSLHCFHLYHGVQVNLN